MVEFSALALLDKVDTWPYFHHDPAAYKKHMEDFYYFTVKGLDEPLGYIHKSAVDRMIWDCSIWTVDYKKRIVTLTGADDTHDDRSRLVEKSLRQNVRQGVVVRKYKGESAPVYARDGRHILDLDLCGVGVFGVVSYGVHLTGYMVCVRDDGRREYLYWVPRRAFSKSNFPGMLDNFVAGNLRSGESPLEGMVREVHEETGISPEFTRAHIRSCGPLTYSMSTLNDDSPGCQHHCQFVFEMDLPVDTIPRPNDGEVEDFNLMTLSEVQEAMMRGEFAPNRTLTYLAHFIRHGIVNFENEPRLMEVCARLHRRHDLFFV